MDTARGVAVLLVVFGHAVFTSAESPHTLTLVVDFFRPFRIPTLLVLSGLLLSRSLRQPPKAYLNGKWRGVLWPFIVWNLIVWVMLLDRPPLWDATYWLQPGHLWYLQFLCGYYVIGLLLRRAPAAVTVALLALCWFLVRGHADAAEFFRYGIFFFVGHWVASRRALIAPRSWRLLVPAALGAGLFATLHTMGTVDYRHPLSMVASLAGVAAIIGLSALVDRTMQPRFLRWVGRNSLIFYVTHFPAVVVLVHLQQLLWPAGGAWHWVANLAAGIGASALATWMQRYWFATLPYRAPMVPFKSPRTPGPRAGANNALV